jgi:hypothetical protein
MADEVRKLQARIDEQYLVDQVNSLRKVETHRERLERVREFDSLYDGDFTGLFSDEDSVPNKTLIENKLKNATHDLTRLASEARGTPIFMRQKDGKEGAKKAALRGVIAMTLWKMAKGRRFERQLYMDAIAGGFMALAAYHDPDELYPQALRLDPRFVYPDYRNNELHSLVYMESMKERQAAHLWPHLGLNDKKDNDKDVTLTTYYDDHEVVQSVVKGNAAGAGTHAFHVSVWTHKLGCIPVAFVPLDAADGSFHGLFDQLGGPMMVRNKIVRLLVDYLESMVHAPWEEKNMILGPSDEEPGPLTVYQHDPNAEGDSFARRIAPAAPAGSVFGLMQLMQGEEQAEAIQPPSRVGIVRQSIASGSFVDSTQGTLSSVVYELQEAMSELREQWDYIAFKIDRKWLNKEKPLYRAVGTKNTYTPESDMGDFFYHSIEYGAGAGVNRAEAANRVQLDLGAGLISKEMAREQIDYIYDTTTVQQQIDQEQLSNVFFQRFSTDPNTPMSMIATAIMEMAKGKDFIEVITALQPELLAKEEAQAQQQPEGITPPADNPAEENVETLEAGGQLDIGGFQPPPLQQQIVRSPQL